LRRQPPLSYLSVRISELARELADLMPGQRLYTFLAERSASGAYTSQLAAARVRQRCAPSIRRFSYMPSPLNDPEG